MVSSKTRQTLERHPYGDQIIELMEAHGHQDLYETQKQAFESELETGSHLLVAQTGNGKTLCVEHRIKKDLDDNRRVAYLVPSKALKNEKENDLNQWCDKNVCVAGKHNDAYEDGEVVIATFEGFYSMLLRHPAKVKDIHTAVLDDFHLLYDDYRGFNLEKVISMLMYNNTDIFAMSATVGSPEKLASWISHGDTTLTVSGEDRQIPIEEQVLPRESSVSIRDQVGRYIANHEDQGPFLVFNKSKNSAEQAAKKIAQARGWVPDRQHHSLQAYSDEMEPDTGGGDEEEVRDYEDELEDRVDGDLSEPLKRLAKLLSYNVGYHHAGMPSDLKGYIEELFADGKIDVITLTTTLGSGYDAPVQTVIVADFKRWTGSSTEDIGVWEYEQWIGRAARPGYGHGRGRAVIVAKNEERVEKYLSPREMEDINSQVRKNELLRKFLLELVVSGRDTKEEIDKIIKNTLWVHDQEDEIWGIEYDYEENLGEAARWLKKNGFISRKDVGFDADELGTTAVNYGLNKYGRYSLQGIKQIYDWIQSRGDINEYKLLEVICSAQNISLYKSDDSDMTDEFKKRIRDEGLDPDNRFATTAFILRRFWVQNEDMADVSEDSGYRAEYVRPVARDVTDALDLAQRLIELSPGISVGDDFHMLTIAMKHGVRLDEARLVHEVRGLGRERVRGISQKLQGAPISRDSKSDDVGGKLETIVEDRGPEFLIDWLEDVHGIETTIATRVTNAVSPESVEDHTDQADLAV